MSLPSNDPKRPINQSEDIVEYVKTHARETIAFVLLLVGIILLFFDRLYGGLLVGIVTGIFFGEDVVNYLKNLSDYLQSPYFGRTVISLGVAIAFFICAPSIFLGAAIAIGIQVLFNAPKP